VKLLCVCTGNTCRSPMLALLLAEALRRHGVVATVESAGTAAATGDPASDGAMLAMARRGLDLSAHRSRPVHDVALASFHRIFTVSSRHAAFIRAQGVEPGRIEVLAADRGGVPDPFGGDDAAYEVTARTLDDEARRIAAALAATSL